MAKKKSHICSSIYLFELQCRRLNKNCHVKNIYQQILSIWHISVNLHRILFNLFVLIVNLNLYCSSEAKVKKTRLKSYRDNLTLVLEINYAETWSLLSE